MECTERTLFDKYPSLNELSLREEIIAVGKYLKVNQGDIIIDIGSYTKMIPLVINVAIKVVREDGSGNELLYPGHTCAFTLNCCMVQGPSEIRAVAEEDSEFITIPVENMNIWLRKYSSWQNFIISYYGERFNELLNTIDNIAFLKMDERLLQYLQQKRKIKYVGGIRTTHQEIANDLNTSREVV